MTRFRKQTYRASNEAGAVETLDVEIQIDSQGSFYANLPEHLRIAFKAKLIDVRSTRCPEGRFRARASTFAELDSGIAEALKAYVTPEITETPVIRYNIESHVSFAEDDRGQIFPNAGYPGARWSDGKDGRYGNHHAADRAPGGYSLIIGARAMLKRTWRFDTSERTKYEDYYKGGHHLEHDNPAQLLNSWCSLDLGESPKEIPYSDEAALFFHSLLMGMAEISRRIQSATFEQQELLSLIAEHSASSLLLPLLPADK